MTEKTDMERIGLFMEMPYVTVNTPYAPPLQSTIGRGTVAGRQILSESTKIKAATDDGYFLKPFVRIFEGEGESNYSIIRRKWRIQGNSKAITPKPFVPAFAGRQQSGVGSRMGCMHEIIPFFSNVSDNRPWAGPSKRNFLTNPGKKGTGYGYADVCLNRYPEAMDGNHYDRAQQVYYVKERENHKAKCLNRNEFIPNNGYGDYFDPNPYRETYLVTTKSRKMPVTSVFQKKPFIPSSYPKKPGNMKAGTINPYPESVKAEYNDKELRHRRIDIRNNTGKLYRKLPGTKSCIYQSVLAKNVEFRVNNLNSHSIKSVMNY